MSAADQHAPGGKPGQVAAYDADGQPVWVVPSPCSEFRVDEQTERVMLLNRALRHCDGALRAVEGVGLLYCLRQVAAPADVIAAVEKALAAPGVGYEAPEHGGA